MSNNYAEAEAELSRLESNFRLASARTAPAELARLVNEELLAQGINPAAFRAQIAAKREAESAAQRARIHAAAKKFLAAHPEFAPSDANEKLMLEHIFRSGMSGELAAHYEIAYSELRDRLTERTPTRTHTGESGLPEITKLFVESLSAKDMERRMQNPVFVAEVNRLYEE
jgi:hypothetical protein